MFKYPNYNEGRKRGFILFNLRSSKKFEDIEPHEIILDSLAKKKEKELGISEQKFEVPLLRRILQGFFFFSFLIILLLFGRTFQFQVVEGKKFTQLAEENKFIIYQIQAERGVIYDKNFNQLVFNLVSFDLVCDDEIVAENISHQTLILYETKIDEMPGCEIKNNSIRNYQKGPVFSHLIGYTSKIKAEEFKKASDFYSINDYIGRTGLENFYEDTLRKNPGKLRIERDALGNIISKEIISLPESGKSLILWLDADLQEKIKVELEKIFEVTGAKKAVAVALDPQTGGVLSLVSLPDFDNNLFQKGADQKALQELLKDPYNLESLFNRAVSGRYLTGSTIKPFIASAALEEEIIDPEKELNCQGLIIIPHQYDSEKEFKFHDWRTHSWTDMEKAIAESCNVYFYTIGGGYKKQEGLGPTKIKEYLELFGWGDLTGIDLPGEAKGFIPDKEWKKTHFERIEDQGWWDGDTYNLSIGQGYLLITPLEIVNSFAVIANEGKLFQPQIVKEIVDKERKIIKEIKPQIIRQNFINPENLQIIREGMRRAVTGEDAPHASAVTLNSLPVTAAAKTGTAETSKENYYHNWITVFAPYENPEIVLTIMIEDVKGIQVVAAPVAKNILEWYFLSKK